MSATEITLRPATAADVEFILRVRREAMRPHVERVYGVWDEKAQHRPLHDPASHDIIELDGEAVGCQWVRRHPDALELVRLYLLPHAHGRGIGTEVVSRLCDEAAQRGLPVRLRVLHGNPAQRLYLRLGFALVRQTDTHVYMERPAPGAGIR